MNSLLTERCVICLDDMVDINVSKLTCGHVFHDTCIRDWFLHERVVSTCPVCRNIEIDIRRNDSGENARNLYLPIDTYLSTIPIWIPLVSFTCSIGILVSLCIGTYPVTHICFHSWISFCWFVTIFFKHVQHRRVQHGLLITWLLNMLTIVFTICIVLLEDFKDANYLVLQSSLIIQYLFVANLLYGLTDKFTLFLVLLVLPTLIVKLIFDIYHSS